MIDPGLAAIIAAVFAGLTALVSATGVVLGMLYNAQTKRQLDYAAAQAEELRKNVDGRLTQLLAQTTKASTAAGEKVGHSDAHTEIEAVVTATVEKLKNGDGLVDTVVELARDQRDRLKRTRDLTVARLTAATDQQTRDDLQKLVDQANADVTEIEAHITQLERMRGK